MKLTDLNPTLSDDGFLVFDCPVHRVHPITVYVHDQPYGEVNGVKYWRAVGAFPDTLTLDPSIDVKGCWHGHIENGEVK